MSCCIAKFSHHAIELRRKLLFMIEFNCTSSTALLVDVVVVDSISALCHLPLPLECVRSHCLYYLIRAMRSP